MLVSEGHELHGSSGLGENGVTTLEAQCKCHHVPQSGEELKT